MKHLRCLKYYTYVLGLIAHAISDALLQALEILLDIALLFQDKHGDEFGLSQQVFLYHARRE